MVEGTSSDEDVPGAGGQSIGARDTRTFTFVDYQDEHQARSHAMRESWRRRKLQRLEKERSDSNRGRISRTLVPKSTSSAGPPALELRGRTPDSHTQKEETSRLNTRANIVLENIKSATATANTVNIDDKQEPACNNVGPVDLQLETSAVALTHWNNVIATVSLDPFDTFPVQLTSRHHELLHHWLSTHATMMFDNSPSVEFNPMRDVWFPLDLSNAASFYGMMAHAAAHLAYLRGEKNSVEVLKFKSEATSLVNRWLSNSATMLSDHTFAAVVRLMTFERYWGTEELWRIHRKGLERMIQARGGMSSLQQNWRLGLVLQLISLMSQPSWFYPSNNIREISDSLAYLSGNALSGPSMDLRRLRSLWLISFIQDMRNLMASSTNLRQEGLRYYYSLFEAVTMLGRSFRDSLQGYDTLEYDRIVCLFYIGVMVQECTSSSYQDVIASIASVQPILVDQFTMESSDRLALLDRAINDNRQLWENSIEGLRIALLEHFMNQSRDANRAEYVVRMTEVLTSLSREARDGVERCLLHMFSGAYDTGMYNVDEANWTVDSLLSSIHGA